MLNKLLAVTVLLLIGCSNPEGSKLRAKEWPRYVGHSTQRIDTSISTDPFVRNYIDVGNLDGLLFYSSSNLMLKKYGDSLQLLMLRPGNARLVFFNPQSHDTIININVVASTNRKYEQAQQKVDSKDLLVHNDSLANFIYSYELVNKPFPEIIVPTIKHEILQLPTVLHGKLSVLNTWYYGCPACMAEIPGLNRLQEIHDSDKVQFIALFKDSAYEAKGKIWFYNEYYSSRKGHVKDFTPFNGYNFPHAFGIQRYEAPLNIYGYPKTFLLDKEGIVRLIIEGGSEKTGAVLDQQIELFKKFAGTLSNQSTYQ
jgi:thiol-disulfide isomerase/thioredoxin